MIANAGGGPSERAPWCGLLWCVASICRCDSHANLRVLTVVLTAGTWRAEPSWCAKSLTSRRGKEDLVSGCDDVTGVAVAPRVYLAGPEGVLSQRHGAGRGEATALRRVWLRGGLSARQRRRRHGAPCRAGGRPSHQPWQRETGCAPATSSSPTARPFAASSMDVGTAFEIGFMRAWAKPVLGYSNTPADYASRVRGAGRGCARHLG